MGVGEVEGFASELTENTWATGPKTSSAYIFISGVMPVSTVGG